MNVIGYLRVSTEEQADDGYGLDAQRDRINREASARGWAVEWKSDEGCTASTLERPRLQEALVLLRAHQAEALVVSKLDRLSRSLLDFASLCDTAQRQGWAIIALDLGVDMTTPQGQFVAHIMAAFAEFERQMIRQRTSEGLQAKKRQGHRLGRPVTLTADVRALVGRLRAGGASYAQVAQALNDAAVPTAHQGRKWHGETVRGVVRSLELDAEATAHREATA